MSPESAEKIEQRIRTATTAAGKTYGFDDEHDPDRPVDLWFQDDVVGRVLFLVFYSRACRYSTCTFCTLPSTATLRRIGHDALMNQVDHVFARPDVRANLGAIRKIIVSNQGSILDEETFSSLSLMYLIAQAKRLLPRLQVICLETRVEYVDDAELEFLARAMSDGAQRTELELAIGLEAFDDRLRNDVLRKGLVLRDHKHGLEQLVRRMATHDFRLKCYFMQKPDASMSDEEAVEDVRRGIAFLAEMAATHRARLSMHLNPTFAARGTPLAGAFAAGRFSPPRLADVARAALAARGTGVPVFLGLSDENFAVPGGSFLRPGEEGIVRRLEEFNRTQDFALLEQVVADAARG